MSQRVPDPPVARDPSPNIKFRSVNEAARGVPGAGSDDLEHPALDEPTAADAAVAAATGMGDGEGERPEDRYLAGRPGDADMPSRELADADVVGDRSYRTGA